MELFPHPDGGAVLELVTPEGSVRRLIEHIGEDPTREGLLETPARYLHALSEMTSGYNEDPEEILSTSFSASNENMIVVRRIPFWSLCEHHLLPFHGVATVGYLPHGRILGLSKLARLVQCFAKRLQIQERLTMEIAEAIYGEKAMKKMPLFVDEDDCTFFSQGAGVLIEGFHSCMEARGVGVSAPMITSALLGKFRDECRDEFLSLARLE